MCECCSGGKSTNKYKKFAFLNENRHDHQHGHDHQHDHDHHHDHHAHDHSSDPVSGGHVHDKD